MRQFVESKRARGKERADKLAYPESARCKLLEYVVLKRACKTLACSILRSDTD